MHKENIENIEKIGTKFTHLQVKLILTILTLGAALLVIKFEVKVISFLDVYLIGFVINLFFSNMILKLQMKSLLRALKNNSK